MVSSNGKFPSFLVRILVQKDNTDNKVFKKEFYTKETRKKEIKKIKVWFGLFGFMAYQPM